MKEEEIKRLIKIVEESSIGQLEVSRWGRTIKITKFPLNSHTQTNSGPVQAYAAPLPQPELQQAAPAQEDPKTASVEAKAGSETSIEIKAPMVGTFYRSPTPETEPYVDVNTTVKKGDVLCIIEAMKLMNEIEAEHAGRIVEILVENAQPVEYNQPLFRIEPS